MKRILLSAFLVVSLGGCIGYSGLEASWETALACRTYGSSLRALTAISSQLKPAQIQAVNRAKNVAGPICKGAKPGDTPEATLRLLNNAVAEMQKVQKEAKK